MSFSVLMGLAGTGNDSDTNMPEAATSAEDLAETENIGISSREYESESSFNDTMSLDSETLQDFGSMVSLPPGTLAGLLRSHMDNDERESTNDGELTIVSSAPSGAMIPPPIAYQESWGVSPHPHFVPGNVQSISTVCTETLSYQNLMDDATSQSDQDEEETTSVSTSSLVRVRTPPVQSSSFPEGHDPVAFVTTANHLLSDSAKGRHWYTRFSENEWEQLRNNANMVLSVLDPSPTLLPLPPSPPPVHSLLADASMNVVFPYSAAAVLPPHFICGMCKDVIVGALTLGCACETSCVCLSCWENQDYDLQAMLDQLDFVWIEQRHCPACHGSVNSSVSCHALDVAILQIVMSHSDADARTRSLKHNYYSRLEAWRETILDRNLERSQKDALRHDELLAGLIQEEENAIWEQCRYMEKEMSSTNRNLQLLGQATVALIAATIASASWSALARR